LGNGIKGGKVDGARIIERMFRSDIVHDDEWECNWKEELARAIASYCERTNIR
jgi:hypothetical protein